MKYCLSVVGSILCFALILNAKEPEQSNHVELLTLTSKVFNNTRTIRVLLPPDYRKSDHEAQKYPVFYFNDGLMVFDNGKPGLKIEEIAYDLINSKSMPPVIFVGIDNGACTDTSKNEIVDRADEYLPYADAGFKPGHTYDPEPENPHGKMFPDFLINEVMPLINQHYRILSGPENTGIGGFSYGGVSALYTVITRPNVFGKLLLESTPLWIGPDGELMKDAAAAKTWPAVVYIESGTRESDDAVFNAEGKKNQQLLVSLIRARSPQTRVGLHRQQGATHNSVAWRSRLPKALQFLFAATTNTP